VRTTRGEEKRERGKAVVLVTHQLQYLPMCDNVLVLDRYPPKTKANKQQNIP
jgi:ABC-type lipoprotein export system ATPase subunit